MLGRVGTQLDEWIASMPSQAPEWRDKGGVSNDQLWLTASELDELSNSVRALFDSYQHRDAGKNLPEGSRPVRVGLYVVPLAGR
jgi:hypothetical protein